VSAIYQEFERHLAGWQTRYAGRPDREMLRLCLLALEREENVAVAYSDAIVRRRLSAMALPDDVCEVIRRALVWVWQDEDMHAIYVRDALLSLGSPVVRVRTLWQQTAGAVGGWTVAVRQHRRWRDAPLARAVATLLTVVGAATGRVPRTVRRHIDYCSFRDFCRYNVHTEGTAWLCWRRLTELASQVPALARGHVDDFQRIADDEDRHRWIFAILADAVTDDNRVAPGVTAASLGARIEALSEVARRRARLEGGTARGYWGRVTCNRDVDLAKEPV